MTMKLYTELAEFWPQMSGPEEFKQEAALFKRVLAKSIKPAPEHSSSSAAAAASSPRTSRRGSR
jgi:hypothetical protein